MSAKTLRRTWDKGESSPDSHSVSAHAPCASSHLACICAHYTHIYIPTQPHTCMYTCEYSCMHMSALTYTHTHACMCSYLHCRHYRKETSWKNSPAPGEPGPEGVSKVPKRTQMAPFILSTSADLQEPTTQARAQGEGTCRPAHLPCTRTWPENHTTEALYFMKAMILKTLGSPGMLGAKRSHVT